MSMQARIVSTEASASLPDLPVTPALLTTCDRGPERGLRLVEQAHHVGLHRHIALAGHGVAHRRRGRRSSTCSAASRSDL